MRTAGQLGCIALLACCCAVFYGAARLDSTAPALLVSDDSSATIAASLDIGERISTLKDAYEYPHADAPQTIIDSEQHDYAAYKYRYLFADGSMNGVTLSNIEQLLTQRETACRPDSNNSACAHVEMQLKHRLHPSDHARYLLLKDSDAEQHHTTSYADGIQHLAPLNAAQERALLETRLRMKEVYQVTLSDAPREVRLHALNQYQSQLLGELQPLLSEDQFALLSSYEQTEFEAVRERLSAVSP